MKGSVPPKTSIGTLILDQTERCSYWLNILFLYILSGLAEHSRGFSSTSRALFVIAVKKVPQEVRHEVRVTGSALAMKGLVPKNTYEGRKIKEEALASSMWVAMVAAPVLRTYRLTCFRQQSVSHSNGLLILDVCRQFCQYSHLQWRPVQKTST